MILNHEMVLILNIDQLTFNRSSFKLSLTALFHIFFTGQNIGEPLHIFLSYPSAEPQKSSASSWSFRQQKASEHWKEARPYHLKCLIAKEAVGQPLCWLCHEPAVIRLVFMFSALLYRLRCMCFGGHPDENHIYEKVNLGPSCCKVTALNTEPLFGPIQ